MSAPSAPEALSVSNVDWNLVHVCQEDLRTRIILKYRSNRLTEILRIVSSLTQVRLARNDIPDRRQLSGLFRCSFMLSGLWMFCMM